MQQAMQDVLVVVSLIDSESQKLLDKAGIEYCCFSNSADGMGASLAYAVRQKSEFNAWLIGLADMPFVAVSTIRAVADAIGHGRSKLAAPCYQGKRGHPVGFNRQYYTQLSGLSGDKGASSILKLNQSLLERIEVDDPGCLIDIDKQSDLHNLGR
jgi:molybdenum cofactor cytidylyltransferase